MLQDHFGPGCNSSCVRRVADAFPDFPLKDRVSSVRRPARRAEMNMILTDSQSMADRLSLRTSLPHDTNAAGAVESVMSNRRRRISAAEKAYIPGQRTFEQASVQRCKADEKKIPLCCLSCPAVGYRGGFAGA